VRVPRRIQELRADVRIAIDTLTQQLGHSPTLAELAAHLYTNEAAIIAALDSAHAYRAVSLDTPVQADEPAVGIIDTIGEVDPALEGVENQLALSSVLTAIPRRERQIIVLRFFGNMIQSEIAAELGISQMHVSRLLTQALDVLRQCLVGRPQTS
jgi:RNA polymerase sigma-B factor